MEAASWRIDRHDQPSQHAMPYTVLWCGSGTQSHSLAQCPLSEPALALRLGKAPLLRSLTVLLVPARLPVLLLALGAAVEGDLALGAGAVLLDAGDGSLGGAAVGAVADGGRGCGASFLACLPFALFITTTSFAR